MLLLDEPTASVEPESEALIHESILRRTGEGLGTTLLVTHRVDLLRQAPRILFLERGRLVADGRHADLIVACPEYADAYHHWEETEEVTPGPDAGVKAQRPMTASKTVLSFRVFGAFGRRNSNWIFQRQ